MPWVRLDDQFADHPKVLAAGKDAAWLDLAGFCYSARHQTDGFIPSPAVPGLGTPFVRGQARLAQRLVEVGLWEACDGGFRIHDWDQYNPSRSDLATRREQRAEAGRMGGQRSGAARRSKTAASASPGASAFASHTNEANANPRPLPRNVPSPSEHLPEIQTARHDQLSPPAAAERVLALPKSLEPRYSADFEAWWSAYPRKREKVEAFGVYEKTLKAGATVEQLLAAARNYATAADEDGAEDRHIKLPATFLSLSTRPWLDFRDGVPRPTRMPRSNGHAVSKLAQNAAILRSITEQTA